jgi:hypothetical protein
VGFLTIRKSSVCVCVCVCVCVRARVRVCMGALLQVIIFIFGGNPHSGVESLLLIFDSLANFFAVKF